jgi:hypothetical protein
MADDGEPVNDLHEVSGTPQRFWQIQHLTMPLVIQTRTCDRRENTKPRVTRLQRVSNQMKHIEPGINIVE